MIMGFLEIENAGKRALEQFPAVKRSCKRVYQLASVASSKEKFKSEGEVIRVTPEDGYEYFYGYYDEIVVFRPIGARYLPTSWPQRSNPAIAGG